MRTITFSLFVLTFTACGTAPTEAGVTATLSREASDAASASSGEGVDIGATDCTVGNVNGWLVDYYVGPVENGGGWLAIMEMSNSGSSNTFQNSIPASDSNGPNGTVSATMDGVTYSATYSPGTNGQRIATLTIAYGNGQSVVVSPNSSSGYCQARLFSNMSK